MKLCISNIAWSKNQNAKVINLLKKEKIKYLEYAPDLLLNKIRSKKNITDTKKFWKKNKINLYSMQSILFNVKNAFVFGNLSQQNKFYEEIKKKIYLAKKLGSKVIVFGSPKSKKTFGKTKKELDVIFEKNIRKIIKICQNQKIIFCLEANPKIYNSKYLTHTFHALSCVKKIKNKFLKLNLDLGTIISNKESYMNLIRYNQKLIGHVQVSCPKLQNPILYKKSVKKFISVLNKYNYNKVVSIEFLKRKKTNYNDLKKIIKLVKNV